MNQTPSISWNWYSFQQLSNEQLYELLALRQNVFILEQRCFYPDIDGLDPQCLHLLGVNDDRLIAYLRLIPAQFHQSGHITLGRIISAASNRGSGIGKAMMAEAMEYIAKQFPQQSIQIAAQSYLQNFYQTFGFVCISEPYDEDGIMHIDMLHHAKSGD